MKILAIETSTMLGGVAVMDDKDGLVSEVRVNVKATLSERLMTGLDFVLSQSGLGLDDMDVLAVSTGPGSFTGLRIGLSTAKGLSFSTGLPIVAVPTLEAFAWGLPCGPHPVCPMLDARKKEVYAGLFAHKDGDMTRLIEERACKAAELLDRLGNYEGVIFTGEGALLYRELIVDTLGARAHFAPPAVMVPSPASLAHLGLKLALQGRFSDPASLKPFYIRKSEAELKGGE
jgi:tRNA threonylcarbamoyladenosine biosynthesis protein TsaB